MKIFISVMLLALIGLSVLACQRQAKTDDSLQGTTGISDNKITAQASAADSEIFIESQVVNPDEGAEIGEMI
ncbi:MAG: hypothetical protein V1859_08360 [archaeon]